MKIAVIYRPRSAPPAEAMPEMFQGVGEWLKNYGDSFEFLYFFAGGGGFGVADIDDSAEVQKMMVEHPFTAYSDVDVRVVLDAETALRQIQESLSG